MTATAVGALAHVAAGCSTSRAPDKGGLMLIVAEDGPLSLDRLQIDVAHRGATLRHDDLRIPVEVTLPTRWASPRTVIRPMS